MCAEFIIGTHSGSNIRGAFRTLGHNRSFGWVSIIGILSSILILSFYSVVAGWTLRYIFTSLAGFDTRATTTELHQQFELFSSDPAQPVYFTLIFLLINYLILSRGIRGGIERMSNILMPLLFVILIGCTVNSLLMPGAAEGVKFLFQPDFSKVTPSVILGAMGQAFFSLSLGLGCLITYSSYFPKTTPLMRTSLITAVLDTFVAILAGLIIFPAVFTYGQEPAAGPKLVFEVLPSIFAHLAWGNLWAAVFFFLLFIASLTSTISMAEISIAYFSEEYGMSRRSATLLTIGIAMALGSLCALSFGPIRDYTIFGLPLFDLLDYLTSNIMLPIGGVAISIFAGWVLKRSVVDKQLAQATTHSTFQRLSASAVIFCLRWLAPVCISLVFLGGLGVFGF